MLLYIFIYSFKLCQEKQVSSRISVSSQSHLVTSGQYQEMQRIESTRHHPNHTPQANKGVMSASLAITVHNQFYLYGQRGSRVVTPTPSSVWHLEHVQV